jgi:hypothetical protein
MQSSQNITRYALRRTYQWCFTSLCGLVSGFSYLVTLLVSVMQASHTFSLFPPHFHPTLHVLHAVLKLPGLYWALVVAGDPPLGVGGALIVRFPLFFFLVSVSMVISCRYLFP